MYWRQGRCLPYGEGVTYWALSEMVKAHAGILETDSARTRCRRSSAGVVAEASRGRFRPGVGRGPLRPLVGLAERRAASGATGRPRRSRPGGGSSKPSPREAAWSSSSKISTGRTTARRISSTIWSSGRAGSRCSSSACRPGAPFTSSPAGAEGSRTRRRSRSRRSSDDDTARLVHALLERSRAPRPTFRRRSSSVPAATPSTPRSSPAWSRSSAIATGSALRLPESVQGIIAARLDALPIEEKLFASRRSGRRQGLLARRAPSESAAVKRS